MGQKDFTDWNGRKRKEIVRPAPVRDVQTRRRAGKKVVVGIKTKADRYRAALSELARYWTWRRERWMQVKKWNKSSLNEWWPDWSGSVRERIKKLRQLKNEYQRDGSWERVREAVKP